MIPKLLGLKARRIVTDTDPHTLAEAIGVTITSYYRFENGTRRIYLDKAVTLASILNCTVDDLLGQDVPQRRTIDAETGSVVIAGAVPEGWDVD